MNPIYTSSHKNDLHGYTYTEFLQKFDEICTQHKLNGRAKTFAFIIYDFHSLTNEVLQNKGVLHDLNSLSGKDISIFYLDGQKGKGQTSQVLLYANFKKIVLQLTGAHAESLPCIAFFDFIDPDVTNLSQHKIRDDAKFILFDISNAIHSELKRLKSKKLAKTSKTNSIIADTPKIIYTEFIKLLLSRVLHPI